MNKTLLIIISMTAILGVGGAGMYASLEYSPIESQKSIELELVEIIQSEPMKLTKNHEISKLIVKNMIETYENGNQELSALDKKLGFKVSDGVGLRYGFVLENEVIVAHYIPKLIGDKSFAMDNSLEPREEIISALEKNGEIWLHYDFYNPETQRVDPKTSFFKMHDGLIFGSGFYN